MFYVVAEYESKKMWSKFDKCNTILWNVIKKFNRENLNYCSLFFTFKELKKC